MNTKITCYVVGHNTQSFYGISSNLLNPHQFDGQTCEINTVLIDL